MPARDSLLQQLALLILAVGGSSAYAGNGNGKGAAAAASFDHCFDHQARRYGLDAELLRGVARAESGMQPHVTNDTHIARTGTRDLGLMQINTGLLPKLARHGITERELMDPCTNIEVGAWVLSDTLRRHGNSWQAVGAYNAVCTQLKGQACTDARSRYAWKVYRRMGTAQASQTAHAAQPTTPRTPPRPVLGAGLVSVAVYEQRPLEANWEANP